MPFLNWMSPASATPPNSLSQSSAATCMSGAHRSTASVPNELQPALHLRGNKPKVLKLSPMTAYNPGYGLIYALFVSMSCSDFCVHLFGTLKRSVSYIYVSGSVQSCGRGIGQFRSRLLSLQIWLSSACAAHSVSYIDNINLFWERRKLFRNYGIHPNWLGAKLPSTNISYCVAHPDVLLSGSQNISQTSTRTSPTTADILGIMFLFFFSCGARTF